MVSNVSTFLAELAELAELAALMEKYEIHSMDENIWLFPYDKPAIYLGEEVTPEYLFKLSKELDK